MSHDLIADSYAVATLQSSVVDRRGHRPMPGGAPRAPAGNGGTTEFKTLAELRKLCPPFEAHSRVVTGSLGVLFRSRDLSR